MSAQRKSGKVGQLHGVRHLKAAAPAPRKSKKRASAIDEVTPTASLPIRAPFSESPATADVSPIVELRSDSKTHGEAKGALSPERFVPPHASLSPNSPGGQSHRVTQKKTASVSFNSPDGGGHQENVAHQALAAPVDLSETIRSLAKLHRSRLNFVSAKVKIELQIKAIQRQEHARTGCEKATHAKCPGVYKIETSDIVTLREMALKPLEVQAQARLKVMIEEIECPALAHVVEFADATRGFGRPSLAQIIAEAGDLCGYANPAKLWSRMGLGLNPDHGSRYDGRSPRRRSLMHIIGDNFVRAGGPYKELYNARKEFERTKPPCGKSLKNAKGEPIGECKDADGANCCKAGHIHNRALRYIEKRLLRELWRTWNRMPKEIFERPEMADGAVAPMSYLPSPAVVAIASHA